jgi:hypothetical protein
MSSSLPPVSFGTQRSAVKNLGTRFRAGTYSAVRSHYGLSLSARVWTTTPPRNSSTPPYPERQARSFFSTLFSPRPK